MKKNLLKKTLITLGLFIIVLFIALVSIPILFKNKIKDIVIKGINDNVEAIVSVGDVDLSLLQHFPNAGVSIKELLIINKAPFEGDTLVYLQLADLRMSVKELFKGRENPMIITSFLTKNGLLTIHVNQDGIANYDIALKTNEPETEKETDITTNNTALSFKIQKYAIENYTIRYQDDTSKMKAGIDSLYHRGTGDFTSSILDLNTHTRAKITFEMDSTKYMKNVALSLDAIIEMDLDKSYFTFKENKALINQLPLEFDGSLQLLETGQDYNLSFKTPNSSFKNALGLVPEVYSGSLENVQTTGGFTLSGVVKGLLSDKLIPKFNIEMISNGASFKFPELPKAVDNIMIDIKIANETGIINDTHININTFSFKIDQDTFSTKATISNIAENALVRAELNGIMNLANITKAYPISLDIPLEGILKANVMTSFDMKSIEQSNYQNIQNTGNISLSKFKYTDDTGKVFYINTAAIDFNTSRVNLKEFDATTGKSDIKVSGTLDNFYGFLFKNQTLKGYFNLTSNQLAITDFMTTEQLETTKTEPKANENSTATTTPTTTEMKIPKFLDCTLTTTTKKILYDNLVLENVTGRLIIRDETAKLDHVKATIFEGQITADGLVSTKEKIPDFKMGLGLNNIDIVQSFTQLSMLKKIAPIADIITGKLHSTINISGKLDNKEMTPDMNTVSGDMALKLSAISLDPTKSTVLNTLNSSLKFINLKKMSLNDLKLQLSFADGNVNINPFDLKYQDLKATIGGQHSFDQKMNYNVKIDVPAKYLGTDVNKVLASVSPAEAKKLDAIPINAIITGNFDNPKIHTDLQQAVTNLVTQLLEQQKNKLVKEGTDALLKESSKVLGKEGSDLLGDVLGNNTKKTDSTKTTTPKENISNKATEILKGILNKK